MSNIIANTLIDWYQDNKRDLPWRHTTSPYKIWLSEIILQQTRVQQGLPYYEKFITRYPTLKSLAAASEEEVLRLWQGLGYYSRGRNLLTCAKTIVAEHNGQFPQTYVELQKLKGIGKYTAAAIASFAFKEVVPVVDGNVFRVLSRYFAIDKNIADPKSFKYFFQTATTLISTTSPDIFNQAIMELGAIICTPKQPECINCPLNMGCEARKLKAQHQFPIKLNTLKIKQRFLYYLIWLQNNKLALKKRGSDDIWQGLFDFDLLENDLPLNPMDLSILLKSKVKNAHILEVSLPIKHVLTHQRLEVVFIHLKGDNPSYFEGKNLIFYDLSEIEKLPKPTLVAKYLNEKII